MNKSVLAHTSVTQQLLQVLLSFSQQTERDVSRNVKLLSRKRLGLQYSKLRILVCESCYLLS